MINIASGNFIPSMHFAQGNLYYSITACTFAAAAAISANALIATTNQVIMAKNITFTPPKGAIEKVDLLGEESTTTGASVPSTGQFQNAIYDEKSWTDAKMAMTLVFTGHNDGAATTHLPDFIELITGVGQAVSTTHHRHTFGDATTGQTRNAAGCIFLVMKNGVEEVTIAMNNPYVNAGDIKPTGSDGHYEIDIEANCLCKNVVAEIKDTD